MVFEKHLLEGGSCFNRHQEGSRERLRNQERKTLWLWNKKSSVPQMKTQKASIHHSVYRVDSI